jgi:hypothetical protein
MYAVERDTFIKADTKKMDARAITAMQRTWDYVAEDCFVNDQGEFDESIKYRRSEVLELVLDADRMTSMPEADVEAARYAVWVHRYHPAHWSRLSKQAFPYSWYGV